jgi:hypothetical protein
MSIATISLFGLEYPGGNTTTTTGTITITSYRGLPPKSQRSFSGGTTLVEDDDASSIPFSPAVPGDWDVVPSDVLAALDQLAAQIAGGAVTSVNGYTGVVNLVKGDIGLGNVDNTSDLNKPISTATQSALDGKASLTQATKSITFVIDGGSAVPTTGAYASIRVPIAGTITAYTVNGDASGDCVLDVWKANGSMPSNANTITASAKPTLSSSQLIHSTTLTGWTTSVAVGDILTVELESVSVIKRIVLQLTMAVS